MSWWNDFTHPINKALNSSAFKVIFPVQALAQGATKVVTGMEPANQYAAGAAGGSALAGLGALMGGAAGGGGMAPYMPTSTPSMGMAGSTLGGGIGSPLNIGTADLASGGSTGTAGPMAQFFSNLKKVNQMRSLSNVMGNGQQNLEDQQAQQRQSSLQRIREIYKMFPELAPGGATTQQGRINFGG